MKLLLSAQALASQWSTNWTSPVSGRWDLKSTAKGPPFNSWRNHKYEAALPCLYFVDCTAKHKQCCDALKENSLVNVTETCDLL